MTEYKRQKPILYSQDQPLYDRDNTHWDAEDHLAEALHLVKFLKDNAEWTNSYGKDNKYDDIQHHIRKAWDKSK